MGFLDLLHIESLVKDQQERYYQTLEEADQAASSAVFIEFVLGIIDTVLTQNSETIQVSDQAKRLLDVMDNQYWSAQELMEKLSLSHRPTFRKNYLNPALKAERLLMQYPDKPRSPKQRYKKVR
jgi:predicted nucleic acid-binding protein